MPSSITHYTPSSPLTTYVYSGQRLLAEITTLDAESANHKLDKIYTWGLYTVTPSAIGLNSVELPNKVRKELLSYTQYHPVSSNLSAETFYIATDRQLSVRKIIDSNRDIIEERDYDPMGNSINSEFIINNSKLSYGFTGRRYDSESDLYYFRARYYSTELGQFISRDPLEYVDGMNMYSGYFARGFANDPSGENLRIERIDLPPWEGVNGDINVQAGVDLIFNPPTLKVEKCCPKEYKYTISKTATQNSYLKVTYADGAENHAGYKDAFGNLPYQHEQVHISVWNLILATIDDVWAVNEGECYCASKYKALIKLTVAKQNIALEFGYLRQATFDLAAYTSEANKAIARKERNYRLGEVRKRNVKLKQLKAEFEKIKCDE